MKLLNNTNTVYSQFGQDLFLYHNFFKNSREKFYIELGSYHPKHLSNIALFDKCFDWSGICIDMNDYHRNIFEKERRCTFINSCVSNRTYVDYYKKDDSLADGNEGTSRTYCKRFDKLLEEQNITIKNIDLLSIDIEGDEYFALQTFPFEKINVNLILVETFHKKNKNLIFDLLEKKGFNHYSQIGPDDLFVNSNRKKWFPENHDKWIKDVRENLNEKEK
jgi:hypothetical protein